VYCDEADDAKKSDDKNAGDDVADINHINEYEEVMNHGLILPVGFMRSMRKPSLDLHLIVTIPAPPCEMVHKLHGA
jgi:hypothetical protein